MKRSSSGSPVARAKFLENPVIHLEPAEKQLTELLQEASQKKAFSDPGVIVRYAGGWVRDKIIGKPSHDIDIAISTLSGHDFAVQFAAFLQSNHPDLKTGTIAKILANPEKSKHLDTATSKFLNLELDFVQLRTESYATPGSRTPSFVGVGTLEEDAARRDCTMNALYYNVHTMQVEDPTLQGLQDLSQGLIRTPLEPHQTFLDDPLRVLRCIRFASHFDFDIDEPTFQKMQETSVRQALKEKVVKERIGIEVLKMMKGLDPAKALKAMYQQQLYHIVFQDAHAGAAPDWFDFGIVERAIDTMRNNKSLQGLVQEYLDGRLWLMIALLPYYDQMRDVPKKIGVREPLAASIIRDSLKLTNTLETLTKVVFPPRPIEETSGSSNVALARLVRTLGRDWKCALVIHHMSDPASSLDEMIALVMRINEANLANAWQLKSFIDGKKIKLVLDEAGASIKVMKELTELAIEYKIDEPGITEQQGLDKLREYLKTRQINSEGW